MPGKMSMAREIVAEALDNSVPARCPIACPFSFICHDARQKGQADNFRHHGHTALEDCFWFPKWRNLLWGAWGMVPLDTREDMVEALTERIAIMEDDGK